MKLIVEIPEEYYQCLQDISDDKLMIDTLLIKHGKVINVETVDNITAWIREQKERIDAMNEMLAKALANKTV